jgi:ubiquitin C-terminal hydrolase
MLKGEKQASHFKDYVKCKSEDTRKILMEIILYLHSVSVDEDADLIDQYIMPIFNDLPLHRRKFDTKNMQVGLNNLGSTCYMNCMVQTLNSVSAFRNLIMQANNDTALVK